ncbi:uracil-DNA glycosylase [Candidatus Dojkabacteria bacterium]|uniref:Uracil-DNA glycosylase n=1 Tax=Candidatus Dojkabacteria bacterium TaxID=2099670 RepID=A0A955RIQ5_9BACT|nr:uracil-DNA glycosylase [Candidatus Dojkabacteria bacterium]
MKVKIEKSWASLLKDEFSKEYFQELVKFVKQEYSSKRIYPPGNQIFSAFDHCPVSEVKVVIIGQDPYHGEGQANGLCFSVADEIRIPPSLQNIYKEIHSDLGKPISQSGNIERWADQGVLLLNATLTVQAGNAGSHQGKGWEEFTDAVIQKISEEKEHLVFLLWGAYARKKKDLIKGDKHLILESAHPSPFSADRGFFGNKHFSKTNEFLKQMKLQEIDW